MTGQDGNIVLCGSNSYEKKYYFNEEFASLPEAVKKQLHVSASGLQRSAAVF